MKDPLTRQTGLSRRARKIAPPGRTPPSEHSVSGEVTAPVEDLTGIVSKVASAYGDEPEAGEQVIVELAADNFQALQGHGQEKTRAEHSVAQTQVAALEARLDKVNTELLGTDPRLPAAPETAGIAFYRWRLQDKLEAFVLFLSLLGMMAASVLTAHGALKASGNPVFIDAPLLAWAMAAIPMMGSLAVKSAGALFKTGPLKTRFSYLLFGLTGLSLTVWTILFADSYHGLGAGLDLFGGHSAWKEKAFVASQLITEVLVAACLFTRLERIAVQYAPDADVENPRYTLLLTRKAELEAELEEANATLAELSGMLTLYDADMRRQIQAAKVLYRQHLARFAALST